MGLTFQLVALVGLSSGLWMGADAKCPKAGDCCMTCPEDWIESESRCFYFSAELKTWCQAEKACNALGGNLASILTASDADKFREWVRRFTGKNTRTWLGGQDGAEEDCWIWSSGDSHDFQGWGAGEPNNQNDEDCMEIMHTDGQPINDAPCSIKKAFLCVKDLEKKPH